MKVYIACGHGMNSDGKTFDPGCVYGKHTEAALMLPIAKACVKYLKQNGITVYTDATTNNDKNMEKTVAIANNKKVDLYVSIHCDYKKAPSGTMPLYCTGSSRGKKLAQYMNQMVQKDLGIATRGEVAQDKLFELNATTMPACIFECGSIKEDLNTFKLKHDSYGKALAKGICKYLGVTFKEEKSSPSNITAKGSLIVRKGRGLKSDIVAKLIKGNEYEILKVEGNRGYIRLEGWITITDKFVKKKGEK